MNRIFIGFRREDFGEKIQSWECDTSTRKSVRDSLDSFKQFSPKEGRLLVDVGGWLIEDGYWGIFLKTLEDESCQGEIWFYGGFLVSYPLTIRSRCSVEGRHFDQGSESFKLFTKRVGAEQFLPDFENLKVYNLVLAWEMLKSKTRFISFMYSLSTTSGENFHILFSQLDEMKSRQYAFLFQEWLQKNPIFSSSELEICEFLRDGKFEKLLYRFLGATHLLEQYLFPFVITYKMTRRNR